MRLIIPSHRALLTHFWLCAALGAAALLCPAVSRAADPVDSLKKALAEDPGDSAELRFNRKKLIDASLEEIQTAAHLRRAFFLDEWTQREYEKDADLLKAYTEIGARLAKSVRRAALTPDLDQQQSVVMWIADLITEDERREDRRKPEKEKFVRSLSDVVLKLAKDKQAAVRQVALHALGRTLPKPAEAFPVLEHALKTGELGPRRVAAYALSELVRNVKLHHPDERTEILSRVLGTASISLRDSDEWVRGYSLQAILETATAFYNRVAAPGEDLTVKGKLEVAPDVKKILESFQQPNPQLLQALNDPKLNVRVTALQALNQINSARSKIIKKLQELNPDKRETTRDLLKASGMPDPLGQIAERDWTFIARLLKENDVGLRRSAMDFLELLEEQAEPAIKDITAALRDPDHLVRWSAARAIRNISPAKVGSDAVRALGQLLMDADYDISRSAALALEALGANAHEAVDSLALAIADPNIDTDNRVVAMKALSGIGAQRTLAAIPKVAIALNDPDVRVRRAAAETLGRFGPAGRDALPALRQALRDDDSEVRLNASEAILSIATPRKGL